MKTMKMRSLQLLVTKMPPPMGLMGPLTMMGGSAALRMHQMLPHNVLERKQQKSHTL